MVMPAGNLQRYIQNEWLAVRAPTRFAHAHAERSGYFAAHGAHKFRRAWRFTA